MFHCNQAVGWRLSHQLPDISWENTSSKHPSLDPQKTREPVFTEPPAVNPTLFSLLASTHNCLNYIKFENCALRPWVGDFQKFRLTRGFPGWNLVGPRVERNNAPKAYFWSVHFVQVVKLQRKKSSVSTCPSGGWMGDKLHIGREGGRQWKQTVGWKQVADWLDGGGGLEWKATFRVDSSKP